MQQELSNTAMNQNCKREIFGLTPGATAPGNIIHSNNIPERVIFFSVSPISLMNGKMHVCAIIGKQ